MCCASPLYSVIELLFAAGDGHGFRPSMSDVGAGILGTSDTISAGWDTDYPRPIPRAGAMGYRRKGPSGGGIPAPGAAR